MSVDMYSVGQVEQVTGHTIIYVIANVDVIIHFLFSCCFVPTVIVSSCRSIILVPVLVNRFSLFSVPVNCVYSESNPIVGKVKVKFSHTHFQVLSL